MAALGRCPVGMSCRRISVARSRCSCSRSTQCLDLRLQVALHTRATSRHPPRWPRPGSGRPSSPPGARRAGPGRGPDIGAACRLSPGRLSPAGRVAGVLPVLRVSGARVLCGRRPAVTSCPLVRGVPTRSVLGVIRLPHGIRRAFPVHRTPPPACHAFHVAAQVPASCRVRVVPCRCRKRRLPSRRRFPRARSRWGLPRAAASLFLPAAACGLRRTFTSSPTRRLSCRLRCA